MVSVSAVGAVVARTTTAMTAALSTTPTTAVMDTLRSSGGPRQPPATTTTPSSSSRGRRAYPQDLPETAEDDDVWSASPEEEGGALAAARALVAPSAHATRRGEWEGVEFWEEHEALLEAARRELGPLHPTVYAPAPAECFADAVLAALDDGPALARLATEVIPGVFALRLLRDSFVRDLTEELAYLRATGIPLRRPNGMNRHGCILSHLGFQEGLLDALIGERVLRPLGLALYPRALRREDVDELYGFSVLYDARGEDQAQDDDAADRDLPEHADGAALTMNVCLGAGFEGGELLFRGVRFHEADAETRAYRSVAHEPGVAIVHLGQHLHAAAPLRSGIRENLVVWAMGQYGSVRIAPYEDADPTNRTSSRLL